VHGNAPSCEIAHVADRMIPNKAFVVADIPESHRGRIQTIRSQLGTVTAKLPVEITLAGSSGVGPIPEGTDIGLIREQVDHIARLTPAFRMEFAEIGCFPKTGIFYIRPKDRKPFDALHALLAASKIPFAESPFPYTPHCTLLLGPEVSQSVSDRINSIPVPRGEMLFDSISVYTIDGKTLTVTLLHRAKLGE
jgi:2'-5' RNA ligase